MRDFTWIRDVSDEYNCESEKCGLFMSISGTRMTTQWNGMHFLYNLYLQRWLAEWQAWKLEATVNFLLIWNYRGKVKSSGIHITWIIRWSEVESDWTYISLWICRNWWLTVFVFAHQVFDILSTCLLHKFCVVQRIHGVVSHLIQHLLQGYTFSCTHLLDFHFVFISGQRSFSCCS